jgi:hypothetical protein
VPFLIELSRAKCRSLGLGLTPIVANGLLMSQIGRNLTDAVDEIRRTL